MRVTRLGRLWHVAVALLFLQLGIVDRAPAQNQFSAIVTFGTSLSDSGNAFALIKTNATPQDFTLDEFLIPSAPYAKGGHHLTNGSTWVEQLAQALRVTASANAAFANQGSSAMNYAVAGARAREDGSLNINLPTQVGAFLQDVGGIAPSDALYVIEMGSNDVRDALTAIGSGGNPLPIIGGAIQAIGDAITALYAAGARHFLVLNVPPIAVTPAIRIANSVAPGTALAVGQLTQVFNAQLASMLAAKAALPGITIVPFDVYSLILGVVADPQAYALSNVTDACLTPFVPPFTCQNPNDYLFWDGIHPTTIVHGILADQAGAALTAP